MSLADVLAAEQARVDSIKTRQQRKRARKHLRRFEQQVERHAAKAQQKAENREMHERLLNAQIDALKKRYRPPREREARPACVGALYARYAQ